MEPWKLKIFCEKRAINKWNSTFIFPEYVVQYVGNSVWKKLNAFFWKTNPHFGKCRLVGLTEITNYFMPKVSVELQDMLHYIEAYATIDNFDFRIDNVLYDPDTNHYILWDVINK